jgi:hypothetical protein
MSPETSAGRRPAMTRPSRPALTAFALCARWAEMGDVALRRQDVGPGQHAERAALLRDPPQQALRSGPAPPARPLVRSRRCHGQPASGASRAPNPAASPPLVTKAQPGRHRGVTVADPVASRWRRTSDPVGGWRTSFRLARAATPPRRPRTLTTGHKISKTRSFSVGAAPANGGPKAGTVAAGPGAHRATAVHVKRPAPSRTALPRRSRAPWARSSTKAGERPAPQRLDRAPPQGARTSAVRGSRSTGPK